MKIFENLDFNLAECRIEVAEFRDWLDTNSRLGEKSILDFFRCRRQLSAFIASHTPSYDQSSS